MTPTVARSLFFLLPFGAIAFQPPNGGYVGYTAPLLPPVFRTCVMGYNSPLLPANGQQALNAFAQAAPGNLISLFHFAIQHNNRNGTVPIPAGAAVVQRVRVDWVITSPCSGKTVRTFGEAVEYFTTLPGGNAAVDNHTRWTQCESWVRRGQKLPHAVLLEAAIIPIPAGWPAVPAGDNAVQVTFPNQNAQKNFINGVFAANRTLSMWYDWDYDNCNRPSRLPNCPAPPNRHELTLFAETLNPPAAGRTWFTGPTTYCSP
jgi:hypothetical protein